MALSIKSLETMEPTSEPVKEGPSLKTFVKVADLMVFGQKKEWNALEEFWMNKLTNIEKQYEEHMVNLERALLENRVHGRLLVKQDQKISDLKEVLDEKNTEITGLKSKVSGLQDTVTLQQFQSESLKTKILKTEETRLLTQKSLQNTKVEQRKCQQAIKTLKTKLMQLERDKQLFGQDVNSKNAERILSDERQSALQSEKWKLMKEVCGLDTERRLKTAANMQLIEDLVKVMGLGKSQEVKLLHQRRELEDIVVKMQKQKIEHEETLSKLGMARNRLRDCKDEQSHTSKKVDELNRQVRHWKEEVDFKEVDGLQTSQEMARLKAENCRLRCKLAQMRDKHSKVQDEMQILQKQLSKTEVELSSTKEHARTMHLVTCRNAVIRDKLRDKLRRNTAEGSLGRQSRKERNASKSVSSLQGYTKRIWELERQKGQLQLHIMETKRKQNIFQVKLDKYSAIEERIHWTERAMHRMEGDRTRMLQTLKTLAVTVPKKLPLEKLVTDPSILDRIAKQKVLQQRLLMQSSRVAEIKKMVVRLLEYHDGRDDEHFRPRDLPQWKLAYWRQKDDQATTDNIFGIGPVTADGAATLVDKDYYRKYMAYLNEEIPSIKKQLMTLEIKQTRLEEQKMKELAAAFNAQQQDESQSRVSSEVVSDSRLDTVDEHGEEEEEEEEWDLEDFLDDEEEGEEEESVHDQQEKPSSKSTEDDEDFYGQSTNISSTSDTRIE